MNVASHFSVTVKIPSITFKLFIGGHCIFLSSAINALIILKGEPGVYMACNPLSYKGLLMSRNAILV